MVWAGGVTATVTLHVVVVGEGGVSGAESRRWQPILCKWVKEDGAWGVVVDLLCHRQL